MIGVWQDIHLAIRGFRKAPVFSLVAVVTPGPGDWREHRTLQPAQRSGMARCGGTRSALARAGGNFYEELGVRPLAGRLLNQADVNEQSLEPARVVVLGYSFWQRHYAGDRNVIGQRVRVENGWFEIIGIAPEGFRALNLTVEPDVTLPLTAFPIITDGPRTTIRSTRRFGCVPRDA